MAQKTPSFYPIFHVFFMRNNIKKKLFNFTQVSNINLFLVYGLISNRNTAMTTIKSGCKYRNRYYRHILCSVNIFMFAIASFISSLASHKYEIFFFVGKFFRVATQFFEFLYSVQRQVMKRCE